MIAMRRVAHSRQSMRVQYMRVAAGKKRGDMPIYEYTCLDCRRRVSVFFRTMSEASDANARCPRCNGANLRRLVSRVTVIRSAGSRLDDAADDAMLAGLDSEDPRALAAMMRKMSDEMGEPLDPELREVVDRLERGESPEAIEQSLDASASDSPDTPESSATNVTATGLGTAAEPAASGDGDFDL